MYKLKEIKDDKENFVEYQILKDGKPFKKYDEYTMYYQLLNYVDILNKNSK